MPNLKDYSLERAGAGDFKYGHRANLLHSQLGFYRIQAGIDLT